MGNIRYSYMNHFKKIPYVKVDNFREFYYEDRSNLAYYTDWDKIAKYHYAVGFEGTELMPFEVDYILGMFGSARNFTDFIGERGLKVSGMFYGAGNTQDRASFRKCVDAARSAIETIESFGGECMNMCPSTHYYGHGPLSREQVKNAAECINEMGRIAVDHGVTIGLHNEFFCAINKENHHEFIELTDPRYVSYCLDTAQVAIIGDDIVDFYEQYHDRITTFHLKDTASPRLPDAQRYAQDPEIQDDGFRWFWEPGEGVLDFHKLWEKLKKYQFKGWMTVETDGTPDLLASMALSKWFLDYDLGKIYK
jgi:inosose dehydratase